jgi:ankyrin repeat protein
MDKYNASVAARTKDGNTLMHIASSYGHPDTALAFLKKGVPMLMPNKVRKCQTGHDAIDAL